MKAMLFLLVSNCCVKRWPKAFHSRTLAVVKERVVFTTHTPVVAGNETHGIEDMLDAGAGLDGNI